MTINKIGLSALAATVLVSVAYAGTLTTSGTTKLGTEKLSLSDLNVTDVTKQAGVVYTPTAIPAGSLKNPIFKFTFANAKTLLVGTKSLGVFEVVDGNVSSTTSSNYTLVGITPTITGTNNEVISFNAATSSTYVYNNKKYVIRDLNSSSATVISDTQIDANLTAIVVKDSTSAVTLSAALYSGDSQALNDSTSPGTLYTISKEYSAKISAKLNARIDAASTFYKFYDQNVDGTTLLADNFQATITQDTTIVSLGRLGSITKTVVLYPDQNLTKNAIAVSTSASPSGSVFDNNITVTSSTSTTEVIDTNLTVNGSTKIEKTIFGAEIYVTSGSTKFPLVSNTGSNAGIWTIYGYNAQIPNVASTSSVDVTMKFTNRSTLNTNIYFTLIDPDGTVANLNSVTNTSLASLNAGVTGTYKASALLALITDTNFDKTGSFSVEVSIPTTPSSVYGMASFKNLTLGQFKDLPVYNSSTMTY